MQMMGMAHDTREAHHGGMIGGGMMGGSGSGVVIGDMIRHFRTMDTTASGHNDHH